MLIAFEGPTRVSNVTSAVNIGHLVGEEAQGMTKANYADMVKLMKYEKGLVHAFDRVDWITHMAYRLALPFRTWDEADSHTVFAAPETHLVFRLYKPGTPLIAEVEGSPINVLNDTYHQVARMITDLNEQRDFALFKTVTTIEIDYTKSRNQQRVLDFSSPLYMTGTVATRLVRDDTSLVELLLHEEAHR